MSTTSSVILHPYQEFVLCILRKAFCQYFQKNEDGSYNESKYYNGIFLRDEPELHEMRASLIIITSVLCSTALVGMLGQMLVLYIYWRRLRVGPAGYLVIAVATIDLLVCVVVIPLRVAREWGSTFHSEIGCKMIELVQHQTVAASLLLLTAVALDRYWCIARAPRKLFTDRGAKIFIIITVFVSTLLAFPYGVAVTSRFLPEEHRGFCIPTSSVLPFKVLHSYAIFHSMLLLCIVFVAVIFYSLTYSFIYTQSAELKRFAKRSGDWMSKRDKPLYSDSESSDSSDDTDTSDVPHIEMQTRSTERLEQTSSTERLEQASNGNVIKHTDQATPGTTAEDGVEPPSRSNGSLPRGRLRRSSSEEDIVSDELAADRSTLHEPDTQPIMRLEFKDEPEVDVTDPSGPPSNLHSSDEDEGYSRVQRTRSRRRRFHRNPWHRLKTRTAFTMFAITLVYVVCNTPSVLMTFRVIKMIPVVYYMYLLPHTVSWSIYMIMNKHFREQASQVCGLS